MRGWKRRGGRYTTKVDRHEAAMVRTLVEQVTGLLEQRSAQQTQDELAELTGIRTGPTSPPEDPLLARLLPDFHRLDSSEFDPESTLADSAGALRSVHEPALIEGKTEAASVLLASIPENGGQISLDDDQAAAWLAALNDVRLALGTAINVTEDMPDRLPDDDPRAPQLSVYHWLTWMQDSLLSALS